MDVKLVYEYSKELTVLYVEDNDDIRESTKRVFQNFFRQVDTAVNGIDGLDKYVNYKKENGKSYDLVLSDINMPKMDGLEMAKKIAADEEFQAIVFMTAHNESDYLLQAINLGASSFMVKPVQIKDLARVLYKVSQAVCDRYMVQAHYQQLEEYSMQVEKKNRELAAKNAELEKSLRVLDTMVEKRNKYTTQPRKESAQENDVERKSQQITYLVRDDLPELREIYMEIDKLLVGILTSDVNHQTIYENLPTIGENFSRYAGILQLYSFFGNLSIAMREFASIISAADLPHDHTKKMDVFLFLESFIYVLGKWQDELVAGDEERINFYDASLISDMQMIGNMWKGEELAPEECEMEFF